MVKFTVEILHETIKNNFGLLAPDNPPICKPKSQTDPNIYQFQTSTRSKSQPDPNINHIQISTGFKSQPDPNLKQIQISTRSKSQPDPNHNRNQTATKTNQTQLLSWATKPNFIKVNLREESINEHNLLYLVISNDIYSVIHIMKGVPYDWPLPPFPSNL